MTTNASPREAAALRWNWAPFDRLSSADFYAAMCLRQEVFVVEQACNYLDADGLDPHCRHGRATGADGTLVAYARIVPPGVRFDEPSIGRVLVAAPMRGQGLGWTLMQQAVAATRGSYPGAPIRVSAQAYLQRFYERLGFRVVGEPYDDTGIPHLDMLQEDAA